MTCYGHVLLDLYDYQNSYAVLQVNVIMTSTRCHGDDDGCYAAKKEATSLLEDVK